MLCRISFNPGVGVMVIFIISKPANGLGSVRSGIWTPPFNTRIELSDIDMVLFPEATITLRLPIMIMKNMKETNIMPVIVARV